VGESSSLTGPDNALSFWPTPSAIADDLVFWVMSPGYGLGDGIRVLEPSAGEGHLARSTRVHLPDAYIVAVEPSAKRTAILRALGGVADEVVEGTLDDYLAQVAITAMAGQWRPFDLVVMNPPFTLAGRSEAWAEHVLAVYADPRLLAPGGVVGAVVPRIVMTGKSRLVRAVREVLGSCGEVRECARDAFASVGAKVSVALMWAQKPLAPEEDEDG
jgi:predicted RNA methylase